MENYNSINRYNSVLHRMSQAFYDRKMQNFQLGSGQQFFLLRVAQDPGISFQKLAQSGKYDKATATRAVKKLEEENYVRLECDTCDKRVRHIYLTEKAEPVIAATKESIQDWMHIVMKDFTEKETLEAEELLERMMENACSYMKQQRLEELERN